MATETETEETETETEETEEETEEEKPKPEPKKERREESRRDDPAPTVECPDCYVPIAPANLGSHRFRAHGVERRAKREEDKQTSPTPKRKGTPPSNDKGTQGGARKKGGRWGDVRRGWG
jgi:outer membrane biosynthesis protein TonB